MKISSEVNMKIYYEDLEQFHDGVYACLTRGMQFKADASVLCIILTGGY